MKFDTNTPIYIQIIDSIKKDIITGKLNIGDKLPSTRELAVQYEVNPNTVHRVYKELEQLGISYTKRGMGTYIKESHEMVELLKKEVAVQVIDSFIHQMKEIGYSYNEMIEIIKSKKIEDKD